jgi:putative long chain acyl-CoA synthase
VLEFYAAPDSEAILGNVTGVPIGSLGKPLPGTAAVRVASYDLDDRTLDLGPDGLARECAPDEVGLLLAKESRDDYESGSILRGVFEPGDAWRSTGDLFTRDSHGEHWLVDSVAALVSTKRGVAAPAVSRRALENVPAVDLCVAYGIEVRRTHQLVCAATVRKGTSITADDLSQAFDRLSPHQWPDYVQVVQNIDVTTWHRPVSTRLQRAGVPKPSARRQVWRLSSDGTSYSQLKASR